MKIFKLFLTAAVSAVMMQACSTAPSAEQKTDEAIKAVMEEFQAVGISAAVVKDGEMVYNKAFGLKNVETQEPLTVNDFMRIASISKSFTATSIMQLVDKGVVSLDADVSDLIGFRIRNPHHPEIPITLKMVLSHTASIRDKEDYFTLDHLNPAIYGDCVESFFEYKPGEGYTYSNMGLNLAGAILEKLSGTRFDDYVRENVIWKLGLYGGHNNDSLDMSKCALIYKKEDGQWVPSEGAYRSRSEDMPSYVLGYSAPIFSATQSLTSTLSTNLVYNGFLSYSFNHCNFSLNVLGDFKSNLYPISICHSVSIKKRSDIQLGCFLIKSHPNANLGSRRYLFILRNILVLFV